MNISAFKKEHSLSKTALAAVVAASALLISSCAGGNAHENSMDVSAGTMLIDFYCTSTGTENGGYYELVLYTTETADALKLCAYSKDNAGADEVCTTYLVPYKAAQDCFDLIEKYRLDSWDIMENTTSIDGALIVCKFYTDGSYIRVSTEKMPADGDKILDSIGSTLQAYATDDCLIPDTTDTENEVVI